MAAMLAMAGFCGHFISSGTGQMLVAGGFFVHLLRYCSASARARLNAHYCRQTCLERQQQDQ
jgi:hypothetical protein